MHPARPGPIGHLARWSAVIVVGLLVAACGGSGTTTSTQTPSAAAASAGSDTPTPTSSASVVPTASPAATPARSKGPATATFALVGTGGVTGAVTTTEIICGRPSLDGPQIFFLGHAATNGTQVVAFLRADFVEVRLASSSGTTLHLRTFSGTGVSGFDGATGATLDSPVKETTAAGSVVGDLGAVSAISGTIDCGDQTQGTSTIVLTGTSPYGPLAGPLTDVKVTCTITSSGTFVGVNGLGMAGSTPVLVFVTASSGSLQLAVEIAAEGVFYTAKGAGVATLTAGGVTVAGDVSDAPKAGETVKTVHVAGDATCGTTIHL